MSKGSLNIWPIIHRWWTQDGRHRWHLYVGVPVAVAALVLWRDLQADNLEAFATGSVFLTGLLFSILVQVTVWSASAADALRELDGELIGQSVVRGRHEKRLQAVGRLYYSLAWAVLVSLALTILLLVLNTESTDAQKVQDLVWTTAVVSAVGSHLVLVLLAAVNRLFIVTGGIVKDHQGAGQPKG